MQPVVNGMALRGITYVLIARLLVVGIVCTNVDFYVQNGSYSLREGMDVTLVCSVSDSSLPSDIASYQILQNNIVVLSNGYLRKPRQYRFQSMGSSSQLNYELTLLSTPRYFNGDSFTCEVMILKELSLLSFSRTLRLSVYYDPSPSHPICNDFQTTSFFAGDNVSFTCSSEYGNPPVSMNVSTNMEYQTGIWLKANDLSNSSFLIQTLSLTVNTSLEGMEFRCDTWSSSGYRSSCFSGRLYVRDNFNVSVLTRVVTSQFTSLVCKSNIPLASLEWNISQIYQKPGITVSMDTRNGSSILLDIQIEEAHLNTEISVWCLASVVCNNGTVLRASYGYPISVSAGIDSTLDTSTHVSNEYSTRDESHDKRSHFMTSKHLEMQQSKGMHKGIPVYVILIIIINIILLSTFVLLAVACITVRYVRPRSSCMQSTLNEVGYSTRIVKSDQPWIGCSKDHDNFEDVTYEAMH